LNSSNTVTGGLVFTLQDAGTNAIYGTWNVSTASGNNQIYNVGGTCFYYNSSNVTVGLFVSNTDGQPYANSAGQINVITHSMGATQVPFGSGLPYLP
jgi:hypothetical protein